MYAATLVAFRAEINTYQGYSKTCRMVKEINNFYDKPAISFAVCCRIRSETNACGIKEVQ